MQFLGAAQTRERLPFGPPVDELRTMFERGCELPPRQVLDLAPPGSEAVTSLVMPAWQRSGCYGVKVINIAHGNAARGLPGLHSTYVLRRSGRTAPLQRTVFNSVGSALEDLAAAILVQRALPATR